MNKNNLYFKTFSCWFIVVLLFFLTLPAHGASGTFEQVIQGTKNTGQAAGFQTSDKGVPTRQFADVFSRYVNGMIPLMAALFVVLAIYAGFLWMTAQGNEEQVNKAKKYLIGATIGLTIIIGARLFVEFILFISQPPNSP